MLDYIQRKKIDEYKRRCKVLGVTYDCDVEMFKSRYKYLLKKYHPDISKEENCKEKTQELITAYAGIINLRNEVVDILVKQKIKKKQPTREKPVFVKDYDDLMGYREKTRDLDETLNEKYNEFMKKYSVFKEDFSEADPVAKAYAEMVKNGRKNR
jgi:hypothetical protein